MNCETIKSELLIEKSRIDKLLCDVEAEMATEPKGIIKSIIMKQHSYNYSESKFKITELGTGTYGIESFWSYLGNGTIKLLEDKGFHIVYIERRGGPDYHLYYQLHMRDK